MRLSDWRHAPLATEVAFAFTAGVLAFTAIAVPLAATDSNVFAVAVGAAALATVAVMLRLWGVAYAVPAAIAGLLAFDWFRLPPTHAAEFPKTADLVDLAAYLGVGVVVGVLATRAGRRAEVSEVARLVLTEEQAALRRVATLVARRAAPAEVFAAVAREAGELLGVDATHMGRYAPDGTVTGVASWSRAGDHLPVGTRAVVHGQNVTSLVKRTGRPARVDHYGDASGHIGGLIRPAGIRSSAGAPIEVDGRVWGVMIASSKHERHLPGDTESRIAGFTELVATAISNTEAWAAARALAEEQTALRRVATLVARNAPPGEVFEAVAKEVGRLLGAELAVMMRYEADGTSGCVAAWSAGDGQPEAELGAPLPDARLTIRIAATGRPARVLDSVGSPIVVDGRLWGALIAQSATGRDFPRDVEQRLTNFTELVAAAIGNAESRLALTASRARVVAASDRERRRVVADLHDGAQQRLVHTVVTLKLACGVLARDGDVEPLLTEALGHAEQATSELRELAHGILPAVLTHGGVAAAVDALATRMHVEVENAVEVGRLPGPVEATAYFVVAEALTNVAKHAHAGRAVVLARVRDDMLELEVSDDGIGGARRDGSGLIGLADRVAVLNGALDVCSPEGGGTVVAATIPLEPASGGRATPARQELPHA